MITLKEKVFRQRWPQKHQHRNARRHTKESSAVCVTEVEDTWKCFSGEVRRKGNNVLKNMRTNHLRAIGTCARKIDHMKMNFIHFDWTNLVPVQRSSASNFWKDLTY